jgi:hypothetical protein
VALTGSLRGEGERSPELLSRLFINYCAYLLTSYSEHHEHDKIISRSGACKSSVQESSVWFEFHAWPDRQRITAKKE